MQKKKSYVKFFQIIFFNIFCFSLKSFSFSAIDKNNPNNQAQQNNIMTLQVEILDEDENTNKDPLNNLLTHKIGYGFAQQKFSRAIYLLLFSEGCESIVLGLLLPELEIEWKLTNSDKSWLITVVYIGVSLGSYLQVYSDRYGRYSFITWDAILQTIFGLASCICPNFGTFLFARFFYGVGIGICLPLSASYITQISPSYMRATLLSKSRVYWSFGILVTCLLGWIFLSHGRHYRILLFLICLPGIYALYEHRTVGLESLRYLWVTKNKEEVIKVVNIMTELNHKDPISRQEILMLMNSDTQNQKSEELPMTELFSEKYSKSTYRLLVFWISVCFIYYGIMILLPTILNKIHNPSENFKYFVLISVSVIEMLSFQLSSRIMDHPSMGRKKSVYYGFFTITIVTFILLIYGDDNKWIVFFIFLIIKFIITATFMVLFPYTAQIYETMLRGRGLGICSMFGRIATVLLGIVGVSALDWLDGKGLYLIFIVLSFISGICGYTMPYCTLNRPDH